MPKRLVYLTPEWRIRFIGGGIRERFRRAAGSGHQRREKPRGVQHRKCAAAGRRAGDPGSPNGKQLPGKGSLRAVEIACKLAKELVFFLAGSEHAECKATKHREYVANPDPNSLYFLSVHSGAIRNGG